MLENLLGFIKYFPEFNSSLVAGLLIISRYFGFILVAPVLSRKDIPALFKTAFAFLMTVIFVGILHPDPPPADMVLLVSIVLNFFFGLLIGYVTALIFAAITAAGDMMNMQMGLSSAVMFDPGNKEQTTAIGNFFSFIGTIIFINIGGLYWMISAFQRSFNVFDIYGVGFPLDKVINMNYLVLLTGNVLFIGLQMAAPVLIATLAMDVILGIISKTAPQVNVFQLSFLFKPIVGITILYVLLPLLVNIVSDYFISFAKIY